ncbi:MAG: hypothetical protein BGP01_07010 [Paludibacter sp. 47-17]|jgi:hypothetical protein|nr:MAG: hypothetical protein BGP01_07010 [Paludibacter sp. 47-17]
MSAAFCVKFDFILFDACLMGVVETAYELRNNTNYILSPSTETIADGFPYDLIIMELLKIDYQVTRVAWSYHTPRFAEMFDIVAYCGLSCYIAYPSSLFYPKVILIPVVVVYGIVTYRQMTDERLWYKIANESLRGKSDQMLPYYDRLHKSLEKNELFLYNYAAELNVVERYEKSIQIALECEQRLADYDLQMLLAENYMCLYKYEEAEKHYKKAAAMCPVRFLPLQKLVEVYVQTDRAQKAASLAQLIIDKEVKVPSASISSIKNQMQAIVLELILQ